MFDKVTLDMRNGYNLSTQAISKNCLGVISMSFLTLAVIN